MEINSPNGVSIVICCYNSENRIGETIKHIFSQKVGKDILWEVILVNNNSTDRTVDIVNDIWQKDYKNIDFKVVDEPNAGLSNARIRGAKTANYKYILFCDDDNWFASDYLEKAYKIMNSNPDIGVLGGRGEAEPESKLPFWFHSFQDSYAVGVQSINSGDITDRGYVWGAGFILIKDTFLKLLTSGFSFYCSGRKNNKLLAGDDNEICKWFILAGYKLWYNEDLYYKHYIPTERLKKEYLIKITEGFIISSEYLSKYNLVIKNLKHRKSSINKYISGSLLLFKILLKSILLRNTNTDKRQLQFLFPINRYLAFDKEYYNIMKALHNYRTAKNDILK